MKCPICKAEITEPENQYGRTPVCLSCWLDGGDWLADEPELVKLLNMDMPMGTALCVYAKNELEELAKDFWELNLAIDGGHE